MRFTLTGCLLLLTGYTSFAQSAKAMFFDTLVNNKEAILSEFLPSVNGKFLFKTYLIEPDVFVKKLNDFKSAAYRKADTERDNVIRELKRKDIDAYSRNLLSDYKLYYGTDSAKQQEFYKILREKRGTPEFGKMMETARREMQLKKLTDENKKMLDSLIITGWDMNNWELFKSSAAYRKSVENRMTALMFSDYGKDFSAGVSQEAIRQKIVNDKISNGSMKEYFTYTTTGDILKMADDTASKEKAYRDFMATVTNPAYKANIQEIYDNYRKFADNAQAPDFNYVSINNKKVSLKDLRGKYVYIDVWATWCGPCKAEIPHLTEIEEAFQGKNIHFVSLSVDRPEDKPKWEAYVKNNKLKGIQLIADNAFDSDFIKKFNINAIPRFILIDPQGKIISTDAKRPSNPELRKQLSALL